MKSQETHEGLRRGLRKRLRTFRRGIGSSFRESDVETSIASVAQNTNSVTSALPSKQTSDATLGTRIEASRVDGSSQTKRNGSHRRDSYQNVASAQAGADDDNGDDTTESSDLWSAAYREAVESLKGDVDVVILNSNNVAQLFRKLDQLDKEANQESAFLRGVKYLQSVKVPLERFKLALDLASPLTNLEPTATTVFGVVRSITAIAISLASADLEFAKQIGEMLEQISYIDDCDTLGQKADRADIHRALVSVYRKLLEFYRAAFEMLTSRGTRLIVKLTLEEDQLPGIVQDFLRHADYLRRLVQKATWEIVEDIKAMLYDAEIARWLGGGKMEMQSRYHALLQEIRADRACEFLLENPQLADWYHASQSRQLALLGDTGCGKTVAVSFLVDELGRRNEHRLPRPKVCYFYCRDDETGQAVQVVSGLILSLLEQLPGLKKDFFGWYKQAQASGILEPATSIKKLGEFLHKILEAIDRPVFILIDGLDECDGVSRRTILVLLKTLSQKITQLKTVLASRPQEDILAQLAGVGNIYLGSNLERDEIIVKAAVERQLFHLPEDSKALIVHRLSRMAQGNAIWTKMTVELIGIRGIRALGPMRRFLEEMPLPRQLSRLYGRLFSRYTSGELENEGLASAGLKLLAVARRPLSMLELAWAIALGTARREVTTVTALADLVDHQRVLGLIHPFISRVDYSDTGKRQVQLIHQSVKEFILDDLAQTQAPTVPAETGQLLCDRPAEMLEAMATDICIRYLLLHDVNAINLFSEEQMAIAELPQEAGLFDDDGDDDEAPTEYDPRCTWEVWEGNMIRYDPAERGLGEFFVYASCHWLEHLAAVTSGSLLSLPSIEDVCQPGSTRLRNWTQQNCRPSCAVQPRFEFDGSLYDPLGIVSLYGSEAMLRYMLKVSEFGGDRYLPRSAFRAADQILQWGDLARLRILSLDGRVGGQLRNLDFFRLAIHQWFITDARDRNWDLAFDLVDLSFDDMIRERWGNELLCIAAGAGCMPLVQRLMAGARRKAELRNELLCGSRHESLSSQRSKHQSIGEAVLGDHVDVVEYLLGEDGIAAHLEFRNARGENVLHLASRLCNPRMVRVLAPRSTGFMHDADDRGDTALERIVKSTRDPEDRYESARIILLHTPTIWKSRSSGQHARLLQLAVQLGDLDMCRVLLCVGKLNPLLAMTRGDDGQPSLKGEAHQDEGTALEILRLLRLGTSSDNTA